MMKSSLRNMVLVLLVITLVAAAAVGIIYNVTKGPIEAAERNNKLSALTAVLPAGDITNDPAARPDTVVLEEITVIVYTALNGGTPVGYAVETATRSGFSGEFRLMAGFTPAGQVENIVVLGHNETPGLGSVMTEPDNVLLTSFRGKDPATLKMAVRKDGGDIDAITASTITSRAYVDAVDRAHRALRQTITGVRQEHDAATGATSAAENTGGASYE